MTTCLGAQLCHLPNELKGSDALQAGTLVGDAGLTETVFAWPPRIGRLMYEAVLQRARASLHA